MTLDDRYVPQGIQEIDREHVRLLESLRRLMRMAAGDVPVEATVAGMRTLIEDVGRHFADEERLMRSIDYKDAPRHKDAHRRFLELSLRKCALMRESDDVVEWISKAAHWFHEHHLDEDLSLSLALANKRCGASASNLPINAIGHAGNARSP
ncbi:MAG TPA: hemerythrin family protein [Myxococcales bacterium]|nr:hemerythrin family protein [Myxococcales bacterium]